MAIAISNISVLDAKVTEEFVQRSQEAEKKKGTIDFSEQRVAMQEILERANL